MNKIILKRRELTKLIFDCWLNGVFYPDQELLTIGMRGEIDDSVEIGDEVTVTEYNFSAFPLEPHVFIIRRVGTP